MIANRPADSGVAMDLRQIEHLLDRLPGVPFFAKDRSLRYIAVNQAMLRLSGRSDRRALIGITAQHVFPEKLARHYEALDLRVLATGEPLHTWLDLSRGPRGRPVWLQFSRFPLYSANGSIFGVIAVAKELPLSLRRAQTYRRLGKIARQFQVSPEQSLALRKRAQANGLSVSQLERDFRQVFGVSPREFHARARVDLALVLLRDSSRIATVAQSCGYSDHSAFSRHFKRHVGVSPIKYRNEIHRYGRTPPNV